MDINPSNLNKTLFVGTSKEVKNSEECAKLCRKERVLCKALALFTENGNLMCQLMNKAFEDLTHKQKEDLIYEPGSKIYTLKPFPPKVREEY